MIFFCGGGVSNKYIIHNISNILEKDRFMNKIKIMDLKEVDINSYDIKNDNYGNVKLDHNFIESQLMGFFIHNRTVSFS